MISLWQKDPNAVLDWEVDWSQWLATGETITASTWTVPTGLTMQSNTFTPTAATVWLSGGTVGNDYVVTNQIATNAGRTDDRSITIQCLDR